MLTVRSAGCTLIIAVLLWEPVPPLVEDTGPVILLFVPAVVALTAMTMAHELLIGMEPPVKEMEPDPAVATRVPPQLFDFTPAAAITSPPGRMSVKATPASAAVFATGSVMFCVRPAVP